MEPAQDRAVVLAVIVFVGTIALAGLLGLIFLVHSGTDATALLAVSGPTTTALGVLGAILVTTKSGPSPSTARAEAVGYQKAVVDVNALGPDDDGDDAVAAPAVAGNVVDG